MKAVKQILALVLLALFFSGCAAQKAYKQGRQLSDAQDWDRAIYFYSKALAMEPENMEYRKSLDFAKIKASQYHFEIAKSYFDAEALDLAVIEFRVATTLDPTNRYFADSLANAIELRLELEASKEQPVNLEELKRQTRVAGITPILQPNSNAPITLNFPPNTKVKDIYSSLCKAAGINVLFDGGIRDQETFAIDIANVSFKRALDLIAIANKHFYKALDERTIMIIPDNPQKRRDFEDHVVKTFYLSNANPNDVVNTLRGLLDARRVSVNAALNAVTIRDTPAKLSVMERVIDANDKPPSEVVIDVEILEVRHSTDNFYGTGLSSYSVTQTLDQPDTINGVNGLRFSSIPFVNAADWLLTFPSIIYRLEKNQGNIRTLARPSLRALDGKQVTLRLGDQIPIETSTFSAVSGGAAPLTRNFQFRDIGTNIDITPRVHHNGEVTLQLQVEVTSVGEDPDGPAGPTPPTFGNRRINTEIRLKDGETNLLAGLFMSSEEESRSGIPILSDLPILGSLFASNSKTKRETDIVLTLTPHIVRTPNIKKRDLEPFYVGTATNVGGTGNVSSGGSALGGNPFDDKSGQEGGNRAPRGRATPPGRRPPVGGPGSGVTPPPGPTGGPGAGGPEAIPGGPGAPSRQFNPEPGQPSPTSVLPAAEVPGGDPPNLPAGGEPAATPTPTATPAATPAATASIQLTPGASAISVGDVAELSVLISGGASVAHAPMWLTFDPRFVEVVNVTEGDFLRRDGGAVQFLSRVRPSGEVVVGLSRVGRLPGVSGSGVLFKIRFRGVAAGTTAIGFANASLRSVSNQQQNANFLPGVITVQ